jgi:toxin ParE1/3/4
MAQIIWTAPALENLDDIAQYIAVTNELAAKQLVVSIFDKVKRLELSPESGKVPAEIPDLEYRELIANPCRVFYKIEADTVFILHVMRQERDLRKFILLSN